MANKQPYDPEVDVIIWESDKVDYKPNATIQAQVRRYKEGQPKLVIIEEGVGFKEKPYTKSLCTRMDTDLLEKMLNLIQLSKPHLEEISGSD